VTIKKDSDENVGIKHINGKWRIQAGLNVKM